MATNDSSDRREANAAQEDAQERRPEAKYENTHTHMFCNIARTVTRWQTLHKWLTMPPMHRFSIPAETLLDWRQLMQDLVDLQCYLL